MKHKTGAGLAALALIAALTGCGGDTGTAPAVTAPATVTSEATSPAPTTTSTSTSTAAAGAELKTATSTAGEIVVDAEGMSLYFFTKDTKDSGTSACTGECLAAWPPFTTESDTPTAEGVTGELGTITTPEGTKQVTLNGMPLYYFAKDTKAGDIMGQGVNSVWYLSDPAGNMIK